MIFSTDMETMRDLKPSGRMLGKTLQAILIQFYQGSWRYLHTIRQQTQLERADRIGTHHVHHHEKI